MGELTSIKPEEDKSVDQKNNGSILCAGVINVHDGKQKEQKWQTFFHDQAPNTDIQTATTSTRTRKIRVVELVSHGKNGEMEHRSDI